MSDTRSSSVITSLKSQFTRHGISNIVRSDNGPEFSSSDFIMFSKEWNFEHITSSSHYAPSNLKLRRQSSQPNEPSRKLSSTKIPTSLSSNVEECINRRPRLLASTETDGMKTRTHDPLKFSRVLKTQTSQAR